MKSFTLSAIAAAALTVAAVGLAGPAAAGPPTPIPLLPGDEQVMEGDAAVMMVNRMMWECMLGGEPGVPKATLKDRGVQFVCD